MKTPKLFLIASLLLTLSACSLNLDGGTTTGNPGKPKGPGPSNPGPSPAPSPSPSEGEESPLASPSPETSPNPEASSTPTPLPTLPPLPSPNPSASADPSATPTPPTDMAINAIIEDVVWLRETQNTILYRKPPGEDLEAVATLASATIAGLQWSTLGTPDLNNDSQSDAIWRHTITGEVVGWILNDDQVVQAAAIGTLSPALWSFVSAADVNGDGRDDLIWQNALTRDLTVWRMNGLTASSTTVLKPSLDWTALGAGQFEAAQDDEILLRNGVTGALGFFKITNYTLGLTSFRTVTNNVSVLNLAYAGIGDFVGTGDDEILWIDPTQHTLLRTKVTGGAANTLTIVESGSAAFFPSLSEVETIRDFDGDGSDDILWQSGTASDLHLWMMNDATIEDKRESLIQFGEAGWKSFRP